MERLTLAIDGMSCGHCVARVTKALSTVEGVSVEHVAVGSAVVGFDPGVTSEARIVQALDAAGYPAHDAAPRDH